MLAVISIYTTKELDIFLINPYVFHNFTSDLINLLIDMFSDIQEEAIVDYILTIHALQWKILSSKIPVVKNLQCQTFSVVKYIKQELIFPK